VITQSTENFAEIGMPTNPFPGLRPFEFDESHLFFGRDGQSEQLIGKLARTRFLAVVGSSGSGKSSLVRAGLLPALLGGFMTSAGSDWRIAILRPGNDPIGNLARALSAPDVFGSEIDENAAMQTAIAEATLRRGSLGFVDAVRQAGMPENENLLLLVDQFEEIFRFARVSQAEGYQNEAAAFVKLVLEASRQREVPIYVVLTMRSDYLGDCSQFWDLPEAVNESQYLIPRLTRDQLREAIAGPVAVGGGDITPRLVNRLLNDVGDNQDQLPILQHALMRAWDEWKDKRAEHQTEHEGQAMDLCCYRAIGEMDKALSEHADEAYADVGRELDDRGHKITEKIFKSLTEKGADGREIRRPLTLGEVCAVAAATEHEVSSVIETFRAPGRSFLMPPAGTPLAGDSMIDISHESLIRNWKRLNAWVVEEARLARIYLRLAETAALNAEGREGLLRDPALQIALDWREQNSPNEAWARRYHPDFDQAMDFLERSRAAREAEALEKETQRRKELRRTRLFAVILAIFALFSLGLAAYAMQQKAKAESSAIDAKTAAERALINELKANNLAEKALANERTAIHNEEEAKRQKIEADRQKKLALASAEEAQLQKEIALKNEARARISAEEARQQSRISAEKFGQLLGLQADRVQRDDGAMDLSALLAVESVGASDSRRTPNEFGDEALRSAISLLARRIAQTKIEGGAKLAAFSRDGKYLATAGDHGSVRLSEAATGRLRGKSLKLEHEVRALAVSEDAKYLAVGDDANTVRVWRVETGDLIGQPIKAAEKETEVAAVTFSPDGRRLATAAGDTVQIWDAAAGTPLAAMKHGDRVNDLAFSLDGRYLATGCGYSPLRRRGAAAHKPYGAAYLWDTWDTTGALPIIMADQGPLRLVTRVAISPDRKYLATASGSDEIQVRNPSTTAIVVTIPARGPVTHLMFSPYENNYLAVVTGGTSVETVHVWEIDSVDGKGRVREVKRLMHQGQVTALAFSQDDHLSTASNAGITQFWETKSRSDLTVIPGNFRSIAVSASGRELVTAGDKGLQMWQVDSGHPMEMALEDLHKGTSMTGVALSSDGRYIAAGGEISAVWDLGTRRRIARLKPDIRIKAAAISPDGMWLASLSAAGDLTLFELSNKALPLRLPAVIAAKIIAISNGGQYLATADGSTVRIMGGSLEAGKITNIELEGEASALVFSPNGRYLGTASGNAAQIWDAATGKPAGQKMTHADRVNAIVFNPDGTRLATASRDQTVKIWDTESGQPVGEPLKHEGSVDALAFNTEAGTLMATASGNTARLWDIATHNLVGQPIKVDKKILTVGLYAGGPAVATIDEENTWQAWSPNGRPFSPYPTAIKLGADISVAFFSPDGRFVVTGSAELSIWKRGDNGRHDSVGGEPKITSLAFSPNGKHLATADRSRTAKVWDMTRGQVAFELPHKGAVNGFAFDSAGKYLFTASSDDTKETDSAKGARNTTVEQRGVINIWDAFGQPVNPPLTYGTEVRAVALSPDGKYLVAAGDTGVRVWKWPERERFGEDLVQDGSVFDIAFSPQGILVIGGRTGIVEIWDLAGRQRLAHLPVPETAHRCAFSPDGKYLVTASVLGAQVWLWRPKEIVDEACARLGRNLTYREWQNYMGDRVYQKTCDMLPVDQTFIDHGITLAEADDLRSAEAVFRRVKEMEPNWKVDPKAEAEWHLEAGKAKRRLQEIAATLYAERGKEGNGAKIKEAIKLYQQIGVFVRPHALDAEAANTETSGGDSMNNICWRGSMYGYPAPVMSACERAVALHPTSSDYRDSRGLARALTGDFKGAIEDFQYFIDRSDKEDLKGQRRHWIEDLRAGKSPFTPEELNKLRDQ